MIQKKKVNWSSSRIGVAIISVLFFLLIIPVAVGAQDAVPSDDHVDSLALALVEQQHVQDSLAQEFIFLREDHPNVLLDSIRALITVEGNDFTGWLARMNALKAERPSVAPEAAPKFKRPAWVIVVLSLLIFGVGVIRFFFRSMFEDIVRAYYNEQVTQDISKEDSLVTSWPYIFLYLFFSLSLGLFLSIYISAFGDNDTLTWRGFLSLSAFVAIIFVIKILLVRLLASIFELQRVAREYVAVLYLMYFNSMLILMPFLVIVAFVPVIYFKILLGLFAVIASLLFIYKFSVTAFRLLGQLKFSIFYLILYLCALEIAPILILVKALNS